MVLLTEKVLLKKQQCSHRQEQITTAASKTVYIQAVLKGLDYPLIPYAVLKHDPLVAVRQYLKQRNHIDDMRGINKTNRKTEKIERCEKPLYAAWNSLFTALQPGQNFFLYAWASVPGVSSATLEAMGLAFVIATPGPCNTRWLTTRPLWYQGTLMAWCVPVDMHQVEWNQVEHILLSEKNMLPFSSAHTWLHEEQREQMQQVEGEKREHAEHWLL